MNIIRRGKDIILNPKIHQRTLIWLHGLGDSAQGYLHFFQVHQLIKDCRVVLLTAPSRSVSIAPGEIMNSWYNITSLEKYEMNTEVTESAKIVADEINTQRKETDSLFIGGFSQGGSLSLYAGLSFIEEPVNGIIGISSYAMNYSIKSQLKNTPVLLYHGLQDIMVPKKLAEASFQQNLKDINYKFIIEPGLGHGISLHTIHQVKSWVKPLIKA